MLRGVGAQSFFAKWMRFRPSINAIVRMTKNTRPGVDQSDPFSGRGIDTCKVPQRRLAFCVLFQNIS